MKNFMTLMVILASSLTLFSGCFCRKPVVVEETKETVVQTKKAKEIVQDSK
jgi:hypothetical protein